MSTLTYPSLEKLDGLKFRFEDAEFDITEYLVCVVRIEPDPDMNLFDEHPDTYGEFSERYHYRRDDAMTPRPSHFTGRARKLRGDGWWCWWQPPADMPTTYDEEQQRRLVRLADEGYNVIHVIAKDADGTVIGDSYLGGCDHDYKDDITIEVTDMFAEIVTRAWAS